MDKIKLALFQMKSFAKVEDNLKQLEDWLDNKLEMGTDLVLLPEIFVCPYKSSDFPIYAEEKGGSTYLKLAGLAKKHGIWLSAGSVPELADGKVYNSAYVFNRKGQEAAHHRKVHLFDINVKGGISFQESETLTPGDEITVFDTEFGKIGLMICFDIRFAEHARVMADLGARLVLVPGAFNLTTGPAHWELSFRARALDNQYFMAGCAPARDMEASYHSYGHSIVTGPWGDVIGQLDETPGVLNITLDLAECAAIRDQLPILKSRKPEVYRKYRHTDL
ncbi:MAG: carbon-nitrogen hydrolase family protein [Clostridiaceae bacterium]